MTTEENEVEGAVEHGQKVAGCCGEDASVGDSVGTDQFDDGLGADDEVKGVAGEGKVDVSIVM